MDQTEDIEKQIEKLKEKIISICREHVIGGQPLLLSALGKLLGDDLRVLKLVTKLNLTEFLRTYLPKEYKVAAVGPHRNIFSVISADQDLALAETCDNSASLDVSRAKEPRFHHRFWAAFAVPFANEADHRFLDVKSIYFRDTQEERLPHEVEIEKSMVPPAKISNRDGLIKANISAWLTEHGFNASDFLITPRQEAREVSRPAQFAPSALELLIGALDHRQLQAISIPLDAVAALLRKKAL